MASTLKIKRSSSTATPATLAEGELAVSYLSGKLFVGNSSAVIPIGGVHNPGTLTANQALVANSTSGIDKVIVANLVATYLHANGAFGTAGQTLTSNSTGGIHWAAPVTSLAGLTDVTLSSTANNDLLIYDAGSSKWENHTIAGNSGQVNVSFASQNITVSLAPTVTVDTSLTVGNSTVNSAINSTSISTNTFALTGGITVGSDVSLNTSTLFIGNSTVNTTIQAGNIALRGTQLLVGNTLFDGSLISVGNSTVNSVVNTTAVSTNTVVAISQVSVGSNVVATTSTITVGNSTVNSVVNSTAVSTNTVLAANVSATEQVGVGSNVIVTTSTITVGNSTVNAALTATSFDIDGTIASGNTTVTGFINVSSTANIGGAVTARSDLTVNGVLTVGNTATLGNTTVTGFVSVGNSSVNAVVNSTVVAIGSNVTLDTASLLIGNSTVNTVINSSSVTSPAAGLGVATIGNTTITGWANVAGDLNVNGNIVLGDSFGTDIVSFKSTVNTEISPSANNQHKLGRDDLRWGEVNGDKILGANVTVGAVLDVLGNTTLGSNASDIVTFNGLINSFIIPSANLTHSLGNNTLYWLEVHAGNVHADQGYFEHDVEIKGDLTVFGNVITTNVQSVVISDPIIYLAGNNTSSDLVDIGFVGNYYQSATSKHAGLIRDASVDQFYLFRGLTQDLEAEATVNTADPTFVIADLNAYLLSGALVSNAAALTITANSTVNVNITANTLALSTALGVASGGTGAATFTSKGILYGNGTSALQVTAAGTDGQILQANSTGYPVWGDLDGGTF